ncbi:Bug family tripartite tricarboxylate transporter substrate binding protein [Falsiroseomonas sp. HW251]|uniref:Bug family tripartite tricarboxylate transporter substrate binding protein n=1 Tax=Falsiroseomonas sp. HW251 TaxID=3390998 RepID=UPI003D3202CE
MLRRALLSAATASAMLAAPALQAQTFSQTVRIIVPVAPGGTSDIMARLIAPVLSARIGPNVVVENRAGAGGNIGADFVAKSRPDGHTILLLDVSILATNPALYARMPFDAERDLAPVQMLIYAPYILVVNNDLPVRNAAELVAYARANPGRLNAANAGTGTLGQIVALSLAASWGTEVMSVSYRGGAPAMMSLVSNEANLSMSGVTLSLPFVQRGQMRGIAVTGPRRLDVVPDLPTFRELGWPEHDAGTWQGVMVQGQTPRPMVERLEREIAAVLGEPLIRTRIAELGAEVVADGADAFRRRLSEQTASYGKVIRDNSLRAE